MHMEPRGTAGEEGGLNHGSRGATGMLPTDLAGLLHPPTDARRAVGLGRHGGSRDHIESGGERFHVGEGVGPGALGL